MQNRRTTLKTLAAGGLAMATSSSFAQSDDKAPITILVGAASSVDFTARLVADHLREALGRPVVVSSKLGAGGRVALGELKRAAPDGRTLMLSTSSLFAIYPHIYTQLDYDPVADFTPIAGISWFDLGLATGPMTNAGNLRELIGWSRDRGQAAVYGAAPGAGSSSHFAGIALSIAAGVPMNAVHYKDSGVGIIDLSSGRLPMLITGTSPLVPMHKSGKIKLVATSGAQRSPLVPDVPTMKEAGLDVVIENATGLFAPAGFPRDQAARIHAALQPMFGNSEAKQKLDGQGMTLLPMDGGQLAEYLARERRKFGELARASGYKPQSL
ncbi:tripartite tricarboxylate transporter substrate binding protein [Ramlibacter sp. AN1015]|uniref:Bug family tripartite tricarboxylate transporter substrate binding protein n=1 Tax=Ramlibacter sp. AN1015 TaxID=3133428 RepID=UPI0030C53DCD